MGKSGTLLGGILLVAGTTIGGGMLALPVLTSLGGFYPSLLIYFLCWAFMACTGLLFLELCLHYGEGVNLVTLAEKTLGIGGKIFAWVIYLFLFYCLTIAYVVGCGNLLTDFFQNLLPSTIGPLVFTIIFAPFVYIGAQFIGKVNIILMICLAILYCIFVALGYPYVNVKLLTRREWLLSLIALPIAFTSFAYQGIVPTLTSYLNFDAKKTRKAILLGSFLPFITYVIWQWLILGIVPVDGPGGLAETLAQGENAVHPLKNFIQNPYIIAIGRYFAFLALLTSFFGVTLGLLDFLADGLKVKKDWKGKLLLCLIIFIPPVIIGSLHPDIFLVALDYAGGYGCALLLGLMPILMVWSARYYLQIPTSKQLPGGKLILSILICFVLFELGCEIFLLKK